MNELSCEEPTAEATQDYEVDSFIPHIKMEIRFRQEQSRCRRAFYLGSCQIIRSHVYVRKHVKFKVLYCTQIKICMSRLISGNNYFETGTISANENNYINDVYHQWVTSSNDQQFFRPVSTISTPLYWYIIVSYSKMC